MKYYEQQNDIKNVILTYIKHPVDIALSVLNVILLPGMDLKITILLNKKLQ